MFYNFSQTVQCYIKGFQTEMPFNLFTATTTEERFIICHLPVICQLSWRRALSRQTYTGVQQLQWVI